jgi:hypothetical protein
MDTEDRAGNGKLGHLKQEESLSSSLQRRLTACTVALIGLNLMHLLTSLCHMISVSRLPLVGSSFPYLSFPFFFFNTGA